MTLNYQPYGHGQHFAQGTPTYGTGRHKEVDQQQQQQSLTLGHDYEKPGFRPDTMRTVRDGKFYREFDAAGVDVLEQVATANNNDVR